MTSKELEGKVEALDKSVQETQNAIRRLGQENNNLVSMLSKVSNDLNTARAELATLKKEFEVKQKQDIRVNRTSY